MYLSGGNDKLSTLQGVAMQWMVTLPARSIQTFNDLVSSFVSQFVANKVKKLERREFEKLFGSLQQCNQIKIFFVKAFQKGLKGGPFSDALALRRPVSMEEIRVQAEKHVEVEADQAERRNALEVEKIPTDRPSRMWAISPTPRCE
ncbi:hypothetical protein CR513_29451, partial [Mucuna pruriens]